MSPIRSNTGFTLIEMIATVAVLAVLVAVGIPSFQETIDKRRLTGAAEQLQADLQYARSEAIKRNGNVFVTFTGSGTTWCYAISTAICDCSAASCLLDGVEKEVNQTGFRNVSVSQDITGSNLYFEPRRGIVKKDGAATNVNIGTGTITLKSNSGASNEKDLQIAVGTMGRVKICTPASYKVSGYPDC